MKIQQRASRTIHQPRNSTTSLIPYYAAGTARAGVVAGEIRMRKPLTAAIHTAFHE
jgi:hypothetical protein